MATAAADLSTSLLMMTTTSICGDSEKDDGEKEERQQQIEAASLPQDELENKIILISDKIQKQQNETKGRLLQIQQQNTVELEKLQQQLQGQQEITGHKNGNVLKRMISRVVNKIVQKRRFFTTAYKIRKLVIQTKHELAKIEKLQQLQQKEIAELETLRQQQKQNSLQLFEQYQQQLQNNQTTTTAKKMKIKTWSHFSRQPFVLDENRFIDGITASMKRGGLWLSDETPQGKSKESISWSEWCVEENFRLEDLAYKTDVTLDMTNILVVNGTSMDEVLMFDKFIVNCQTDPYQHSFDPHQYWVELSKRYKGFAITPYNPWAAVFGGDIDFWFRARLHIWYRPWDCASVVLWDYSCIQDIAESTAFVPPKREDLIYYDYTDD